MKSFNLLSLAIISLISASFYISEKDKSEVYIATYQGDKAGAYSLIHDDFGADYASGIEQYADSIAYSRGIPFSFAVIAGECSKEDWKKANELISHGHQVLNHSMKHKCGKENNWCSFGNWDERDFDFEIDSSTSLIHSHTGKHPAFFIFPFDLFTDTMIAYLRHKQYAGARAGEQDILQEAIIDDPFRLNFTVLRPEQPLSVLNSLADEAIENKSWAIRVVHGVNDSSWGSIPLDEYKNHLDHLKKLSNENKLWVANLSDVILYTLLRERYSLIAQHDSKGRTTKINFALKAMGHLNLKPHTFKTAASTSDLKNLSIVLKSDDLNVADIKQNGKQLAFKIYNEKIIFDAIPNQGAVSITYKN